MQVQFFVLRDNRAYEVLDACFILTDILITC